jgi:hypothetical protein
MSFIFLQVRYFGPNFVLSSTDFMWLNKTAISGADKPLHSYSLRVTYLYSCLVSGSNASVRIDFLWADAMSADV